MPAEIDTDNENGAVPRVLVRTVELGCGNGTEDGPVTDPDIGRDEPADGVV